MLWRRDRLPTPVLLGFPCSSTGKESACNSGDLGLIPGLERSPGEANGYPLQYSGLENPMDCIVYWVTKRHDWVTFTLTFICIHIPWCFSGKESTCQCRKSGFSPCIRKIPGEGNGNLFQYSCPGNPMDIGAWQAIVPGVTEELVLTSQLNNYMALCASVFLGEFCIIYFLKTRDVSLQ